MNNIDKMSNMSNKNNMNNNNNYGNSHNNYGDHKALITNKTKTQDNKYTHIQIFL
jgi:hypothetical protein